LNDPAHEGVRRWVADLNRLYQAEAALHELDFSPAGFEWIDCTDAPQSILAILRKGRSGDGAILSVTNFTPVPRPGYRLGVPREGFWQEVLNGDALEYGGTGMGNLGGVSTGNSESHGHPYSVSLTLPPLS